MKYVRILAPLGAILALAAAPSAQAAAGTPVTVRVEGKTRTLLASTVVHLKSGWLTRYGAPKGLCSTNSGAGALDQATHHRWSGKWSTSSFGTDYEILAILGEKTNFKNRFWEIFTDNVLASAGVCGIAAHRGEQLLFANVSVNDWGDFPVAIRVAPRRAGVGHAFTVKVVYYDAKGKARPLAGATVTGGGLTATTDAHGAAMLTPTKAGRLVLTATHATIRKGGHPYGYIRAAAVGVTVV